MSDIQPMYFVGRTDVAQGDGEQRVFGAFDTEDDAAAFGVQIASVRPGDFAVFKGEATLKLTKPAAPVAVEPIQPTPSE